MPDEISEQLEFDFSEPKAREPKHFCVDAGPVAWSFKIMPVTVQVDHPPV